MNFKELAKNLEMEEDEFLEMVDLFVETTSSDLGRLKSAVEEKDAQKVVKAAHSIKGAAVNLGFQEIYEVAKRIETNARENNLKDASGAARMIKEKLDLIAFSLKEGSSNV